MKRDNHLFDLLAYGLGLLLIIGFVVLYSSRFLFVAGMPPLVNRLFYGMGRGWAIGVNAVVFILFLAFLPYRRGTAWRSKGAFAAFIVALMAEMFGIPLLLYILSPFLPALFPDRTLRLSAYSWLGGSGEMLVSTVGTVLGAWLTLAGMLLVIAGWRRIHRVQGLETGGIYRTIRHPQYSGLFLILTGWLIHWPTLLTLPMYPVMIFVYAWLARKEERDMRAAFGAQYEAYRAATPAFFPRLTIRKLFEKPKPTNLG